MRGFRSPEKILEDMTRVRWVWEWEAARGPVGSITTGPDILPHTPSAQHSSQINFSRVWDLHLQTGLPQNKQYCLVLYSRAQWKIFFFNFNFWHTFSFVFFNSKTGLFSCIFWSEDSFLCKFSCLCLHSGFTWRSWAKYIGWPKKYVNVLNMQI